MPLFTFYCNHCEQQSEILIRGAESPVCPQCGSGDIVKQASTFAPKMGASFSASGPSKCESCCSRGACPNAM